jgi:EAL domain-containing protein (putative c-di-GMP-specific phosphodiesterase class I)
MPPCTSGIAMSDPTDSDIDPISLPEPGEAQENRPRVVGERVVGERLVDDIHARGLRLRTARREITERRRVAHRLRQALQQDGFLLLYQPQIHLKSGMLRGAEAMLRLQHRRRGLILPHHFMPVAERSEVANDIGDWIINQACQEAIRWPATFSVSVSLSQRQLRGTRLVKTIIEALSRTGLAPARLEVQLTEAMLVDDNEDAVFSLRAMQGLGLRLAVENFGTGYASLAALKRQRLSTLKLDRSMIQLLGQDDGDAAITRAAIEAGHALGCAVLANGVETETQCRLLTSFGCDEAQGPYFGQPVPPDAFLGKLNP